MASPSQWTWVCVNSGSWWWTGKPAMLQSTVLQRVRRHSATELNWTESLWIFFFKSLSSFQWILSWVEDQEALSHRSSWSLPLQMSLPVQKGFFSPVLWVENCYDVITNSSLLDGLWYQLWVLQSLLFFFHIFISWRLITLQYCSGFCHTQSLLLIWKGKVLEF